MPEPRQSGSAGLPHQRLKIRRDDVEVRPAASCPVSAARHGPVPGGRRRLTPTLFVRNLSQEDLLVMAGLVPAMTAFGLRERPASRSQRDRVSAHPELPLQAGRRRGVLEGQLLVRINVTMGALGGERGLVEAAKDQLQLAGIGVDVADGEDAGDVRLELCRVGRDEVLVQVEARRRPAPASSSGRRHQRKANRGCRRLDARKDFPYQRLTLRAPA